MYVTTMPAPETDRIVTLTPKRTAVRCAYRFLEALRELTATDHAAVLELLALELGPERQPRDTRA